jgi:hypothetical protein
MTDHEQGELRVIVPVGFLLPREQEVSVSVERPDGPPLPIRLHLIPACAPASVSDATPANIGWSSRRLPTLPEDDDGYPGPDYGGGD